MQTAVDLKNYADTAYEVWVVNEESGSAYRYRDDLIYSVALDWASKWNQNPPTTISVGSKFVAVRSTTTFEVL